VRRNVFTSYIIRNRLNLKTFFEPIIDFIEIGGTPPLRTVYETFISYSSSKNTQILVATDMYNRKFQTYESLIQSSLKVGKKKNPKLFFVAIMPKYQVGSAVFMLTLMAS
jgi:hypothetical protein